jgi:hypothetical protein
MNSKNWSKAMYNELLQSIQPQLEKYKMSINNLPVRKLTYMAIGCILGAILWILTDSVFFYVLSLGVGSAFGNQSSSSRDKQKE